MTLSDLKARLEIKEREFAPYLKGSPPYEGSFRHISHDAIVLIEQIERERDDAIGANQATAAILKAILDEPRGWASIEGLKDSQRSIGRDIHNELKIAWKRLTGQEYIR